MAGDSFDPVWVPCKSIPIFWLPYKLIVPFEWNSKFSFVWSITRALLLSTVISIVFVLGNTTGLVTVPFGSTFVL